MLKYIVKMYWQDDSWVAVVPDLLVAGKGPTAAAAVDAAISRAEETERNLTEAGFAEVSSEGTTLSIHRPRSLRDIVVETLTEFGLRAAIVGVVLLVLLLPVAVGLFSFAQQLKTEVLAEISVVRQDLLGDSVDSSSDKGERLRIRAERLRDMLTPAAEELRPLVRILMGTDTANNGTGK